MTIEELQHAIGVKVDGLWGPASRAGLLARFTNPAAPAVTDSEIVGFARRLGCTPKQIRAVAKVESGGSAFDSKGRPKILFERHLFHRMTGGRFTPAPFSNPAYGGYSEDSWMKLAYAAGKNPEVAFSSCSWGRFQVLGSHWRKLGYASAFELAMSTARTEMAHYELLVRYVEKFGLVTAIRALSADPATCVAFARGYNGPDFGRNQYDRKLARAMA